MPSAASGNSELGVYFESVVDPEGALNRGGPYEDLFVAFSSFHTIAKTHTTKTQNASISRDSLGGATSNFGVL